MGRYLKLAMAVIDRNAPIETAGVPVNSGDRVSRCPEAGHDLNTGLQGSRAGLYAGWLKRWKTRGRKQ